jgi:two-component system sensor kinase FixL
MLKSQSFIRPERSVGFRYGVAILAVAIALGIKLTLLHFDVPYPLSSSFLAAIAVAFWFGGTGPGVLALVLSALAFGYIVAPYQIDLADGTNGPVRFITVLPYLIYFVLVAALMSWFSSSRRRAERLLSRARGDLEAEVEERTSELRQANQELQNEVSERKRIEETLRETAQLLDLTHDTVFVRDMKNVITYWNRGAEEQYGWPREEAIGQVSHDIIQTTFPAPLEEIMAELKRNRRWEGELVHTRRDSTQVVVASRWALQSDEQGNSLAVLETNNDITERKRTEDALHKSQAELAHAARVMTMGELVASIAHEVNQPLGAIVTNGQACMHLLSRELPDIAKSRAVIGRMIADGMRASEVIKRIRELLHKQAPEKVPLRINKIIQEVIALVRSDLHRSGIKLRTELAVDLRSVIGDRIQLQQVILNLILNGKDALSGPQAHRRELLVSSGMSESNEVVVAVRDSGGGIDPKDADRIFDPFFTTKTEGMGLGLSISRTIIEAHGGRLWATPNEVTGATIQFALPPGGSEL